MMVFVLVVVIATLDQAQTAASLTTRLLAATKRAELRGVISTKPGLNRYLRGDADHGCEAHRARPEKRAGSRARTHSWRGLSGQGSAGWHRSVRMGCGLRSMGGYRRRIIRIR